MPHSASRISSIPMSARNDVNVQVKNGLARGFSTIYSDVVTVGTEVRINGSARHVNRAHQCHALIH